jgi:hypothetical protein
MSEHEKCPKCGAERETDFAAGEEPHEGTTLYECGAWERNGIIHFFGACTCYRRQLAQAQEKLSASQARLQDLEHTIGRLAVVVKERDAAYARIAGLEAVVAKLPKTADGVTVVDGDVVYSADGTMHTIEGGRTYTPWGCNCSVGACYSTPQAAALAKHAEPGK